ncbi:MAG TPA: tRNA 2-thiouridine(34) synthase MnmA, partial [Ruminiclostridium sp.]|nr:tRNA 2-thiouridine(34) synthase MnmA [Ruminiclostridium sp.]
MCIRDSNNVILGKSYETLSKSLIADDINYIMIDKLEKPMDVKAKIRYSAKEADATIYPLEDGKVEVVFKEPQRAVTPGQSVVFYSGDIVVGGGTIT